MKLEKISWPEGKQFAFTIFDDTDRATLLNNRAVYDLLQRAGLRTTKSVWMFDGETPPYIPGVTCSESTYVKWLLELQESGFEIAWHHATWESSKRDATLRGMDSFRKTFGHDPFSMANHASNKEGIYWGSNRLSSWRRILASLHPSPLSFEGHLESSPYFWGDLCQERIRYVRNFVFSGIDSLQACPWMPYHDPAKPWVPQWFASSAGSDLNQFNQLLSPSNLDSLEESGGACIVYTHFGKGFADSGQTDATFEDRIRDVSGRNGWFVPVYQLLEFLASQQSGPGILDSKSRHKLETAWLFDRLRSKFSR